MSIAAEKKMHISGRSVVSGKRRRAEKSAADANHNMSLDAGVCSRERLRPSRHACACLRIVFTHTMSTHVFAGVREARCVARIPATPCEVRPQRPSQERARGAAPSADPPALRIAKQRAQSSN